MQDTELTYEEKLGIAEMCLTSTKHCCKLMFPERFSLPFSSQHDEIFYALDSDLIQYVLVLAPRGYGKSSIMQLAYPAQQILKRNRAFIVPCSATAAQAGMHSENLKRELVRNPRVVSLFGSMESELFGKEIWRANNPFGTKLGTYVMSRSYGQQVRGLLMDNDRPDLYIIDDIETDDSVISDEQLYKYSTWFHGEVLGSIDPVKSHKVIVVGTLLGPGSLLDTLSHDKKWYTVHLEACGDDLVSNWPEKYSTQFLTEKHNSLAAIGLQNVFYREYRNIAQGPEGSPFLASQFKYYDPSELDKEFIQYVVIIDPAKSDAANACDTAIVGLGVDMIHRKFYLEDLLAARLHPNEMAEQACAMAQRLHARQIGIEKTGSGYYATWPLENFIKMNGLGIEVIGLDAKKGPAQYIPSGSSQHGKDARIGAGLVPLYRQGLMFHNKLHPLMPAYELQLVQFPFGKKKDLIDAAAYIVGMMDEGERYFSRSIDINTKGLKMDQGALLASREDEALAELYGGNMPTKNWRLGY